MPNLVLQDGRYRVTPYANITPEQPREKTSIGRAIAGFLLPNVVKFADTVGTARRGGAIDQFEAGRKQNQQIVETLIAKAKQETDPIQRAQLLAQARDIGDKTQIGSRSLLQKANQMPTSAGDIAKLSLGVGTDIGSLIGGLNANTIAKKAGEGALFGSLSGIANSQGKDIGGTIESGIRGGVVGGGISAGIGLAQKGVKALAQHLFKTMPKAILYDTFPDIAKTKSGNPDRIAQEILDEDLLAGGKMDKIAEGAAKTVKLAGEKIDEISDNAPTVTLGEVFGDNIDESISVMEAAKKNLSRYNNPDAKQAVQHLDDILSRVKAAGDDSSLPGLLAEFADDQSGIGEAINATLDDVANGTKSSIDGSREINRLLRKSNIDRSFKPADILRVASGDIPTTVPDPASVQLSLRDVNNLKKAAYYNYSNKPTNETASVLRENMKNLGDNLLRYIRGNNDIAQQTVRWNDKLVTVGDLLDLQQSAIVLQNAAGPAGTRATKRAALTMLEGGGGTAAAIGLATGNPGLVVGGLTPPLLMRAARSPQAARTLYSTGNALERAQTRQASDAVRRAISRISAQQATQ